MGSEDAEKRENVLVCTGNMEMRKNPIDDISENFHWKIRALECLIERFKYLRVCSSRIRNRFSIFSQKYRRFDFLTFSRFPSTLQHFHDISMARISSGFS